MGERREGDLASLLGRLVDIVKILHVYKNYAPTRGGIETHVRQLATGLTRRGHQVTVLVAGRNRPTISEDLDGVRVIRAGRLGEVASTPISFDLIRWIGRIDADLIHLHVPYPVGELGALVAGRDRSVVVTYHSDVVRQWWALPLYRLLLGAVLRRASAIIATSPPYVQSSSVLRPITERCVVVPLGVDPKRFQSDPSWVAELRQAWIRPEDAGLVLFVGKFRTYKGLAHLIDAACSVRARFLLVGDGPLESELRGQVARHGLQHKVAFLGEPEDAELAALYAAVDVIALPSTQRSEAFGTVLLEAMASARPVISTELGTGTSWVNLHERTGLVVPPADSDALAKALTKLLEDRALAMRLGAAGRERVASEFTEDRMVEGVEAIYSSARSVPLPRRGIG
jgi:rhamnosyl/mannosyltransferase